MLTCGIAVRAHQLRDRLAVPLETTHLILVQHTPLVHPLPLRREALRRGRRVRHPLRDRQEAHRQGGRGGDDRPGDPARQGRDHLQPERRSARVPRGTSSTCRAWAISPARWRSWISRSSRASRASGRSAWRWTWRARPSCTAWDWTRTSGSRAPRPRPPPRTGEPPPGLHRAGRVMSIGVLALVPMGCERSASRGRPWTSLEGEPAVPPVLPERAFRGTAAAVSGPIPGGDSPPASSMRSHGDVRRDGHGALAGNARDGCSEPSGLAAIAGASAGSRSLASTRGAVWTPLPRSGARMRLLAGGPVLHRLCSLLAPTPQTGRGPSLPGASCRS